MDEDAPDKNNENQRKIELENGKPIKNDLLMHKRWTLKNSFAIDFSRFFIFTIILI